VIFNATEEQKKRCEHTWDDEWHCTDCDYDTSFDDSEPHCSKCKLGCQRCRWCGDLQWNISEPFWWYSRLWPYKPTLLESWEAYEAERRHECQYCKAHLDPGTRCEDCSSVACRKCGVPHENGKLFLKQRRCHNCRELNAYDYTHYWAPAQDWDPDPEMFTTPGGVTFTAVNLDDTPPASTGESWASFTRRIFGV
jgi:hypothetical protein